MDNKKRKGSNLNLKTDDAEPRRSLRIQLRNNLGSHNLPELPLDVILNIISRLPVSLILGLACKSPSKAFKIRISDPSFSNIYQTNNSNSLCTIFLDDSKHTDSFDLVEFDTRDIYNKRVNHKISKLPIFKSGITIKWSCCNGLICFLKKQSGLSFKLFVTNLILGEFIQLPEHVSSNHKRICVVHGLGFCQLTNKYKVLRVIKDLRGSIFKSSYEIFTIGSDQNWRSVSDVNVSHYTKPWYYTLEGQSKMVPFRSALHWLLHSYETIQGKRKTCICAFDLTTEKPRGLPLPPEVDGLLCVLLDKICVWGNRTYGYGEAELWVMDDYGVEGSWTKQLALKLDPLSADVRHVTLIPFTISPEVIIALDNRKLLCYNRKKKTWSRLTHTRQKKHIISSIPFVPSFVSLRNIVPRSMLDVYPRSNF